MNDPADATERGVEPIVAAADLVDSVLNIARELRHGGLVDGSVIRLSSAEGTAMRYIDRHPGASAGAVAAATGLQRSNLSVVLRNLEGHGLIVREPGVDGRSVHVLPTPRAAENIARLRDEWGERVLGALTPESYDDLTRAARMLAVLEQGLTGHQDPAAS